MSQKQIALINGKLTANGIELRFLENDYQISYPAKVWDLVPEEMKYLLLDNLCFAATMHLPMKIRTLSGISYNTSRPYFEAYFRQNFIGDIPSCCDMDGLNIGDEISRFARLDYKFPLKEIRTPCNWPQPDEISSQAIVTLSLGKDSLLTFALANEIGLNPTAVFVDEPAFSQEKQHKERLGKDFLKEFGVRLNILEHSTGLLRDDEHLGALANEYGWGLQSTEYAVSMLPYARSCGAKYILMGNEQTAGTYYSSSNGDSNNEWTIHPCYDQTHFWTNHINSMTSALTANDPVQTGSLIEPLMDMMIQRILVRRYPQYAKYQMSCFAVGEAGKDYHWCYECGICAKMYLMCVGGGVNPADIGLKKSMLTENNIKFFPIFGGSSQFPYAKSGIAKDEQVFAFHLAVKFGSIEPLVEKFKNSDLAKEAMTREKELIDKFITVYPSISVPTPLKEKIINIYQEELDIFNKLIEKL
ncbi:MAG: hypothetical protein ACJA0S_000413 [Rickettsiales bacterium]|jgi:hypothetical protein